MSRMIDYGEWPQGKAPNYKHQRIENLIGDAREVVRLAKRYQITNRYDKLNLSLKKLVDQPDPTFENNVAEALRSIYAEFARDHLKREHQRFILSHGEWEKPLSYLDAIWTIRLNPAQRDVLSHLYRCILDVCLNKYYDQDTIIFGQSS